MGSRAVRLALIICLLAALPGLVAARAALAASSFVDVPADSAASTAVEQLAARGIIKGCDAAAWKFCPDDPTLRAQMAALIARAMAWDGEQHGNQFADRCDAALGCIDDDLWRNVGALQFYGVAQGYDATSYGPHYNVLKQQVILFISRALVKKGVWIQQPDTGAIYPNLPRGTDAERRDVRDVVTYVFYVGAAPDTGAHDAWGDYRANASRSWFARALWQVLERYPVGPAPSPNPTPTATPTTPSRAGCDPSYPTVCLPPPPPDLDCTDIPYRNFAVLRPDPHHFDADGDGIGCEGK